MFKKFTEKENVSGITQLKSSVQKGIRNSIMETYPDMEPYMDNFLPKKDQFKVVKCHEHIELLVNSGGDLIFFRHHNEQWCPTLRLLHQYPFMLPQQQVDKGAIRFVLSGANIMCPGLTHKNAKMTPADEGTVVGIFAEGKTHALAIGKTCMSTNDIRDKNKGIGVETYHYLNDGLWNMLAIKH
jgi:PUA domain protein